MIKSEHNIRSRSIRSRRRRRRRLAHQSYTKLTQEEKVTQTCARCTLFQLRTHALDSNANTIAASYSFVIVTTTETRLRNNNTMLLFAYVSLSLSLTLIVPMLQIEIPSERASGLRKQIESNALHCSPLFPSRSVQTTQRDCVYDCRSCRRAAVRSLADSLATRTHESNNVAYESEEVSRAQCCCRWH